MRQKVANRLIFAVYFTSLLAFIMIPATPARAIHKITVIVRDSFGFTPNQLYCAEGTYNVSLGGLRGSFDTVSGEVDEAKPVGGGLTNLVLQAIILNLIVLIGFFLLLRSAFHRWRRQDDA